MGRADPIACLAGVTANEFKPTPGRALIQRQKQEKAGRIHLVQKAKEDERLELSVARVVKVGDPERASGNGAEIPMPVKPGDLVLVDRYAGQDVAFGVGGDADYYVIVTRAEILGVFDEAPGEFSGAQKDKFFEYRD